jgi:hypothetical protein
MHLCQWHPLLAQFRSRYGHLDASLSEQGGTVHTVPLHTGNVKQPQGLARREPALLLLWEGSRITGHMHRGSRMTRNSLMILMTRNAIGLKRQDDVRLEAPDLLD